MYLKFNNIFKFFKYFLINYLYIILSICIGGGESPTFTASNSEEESKILFYFLLRHYILLLLVDAVKKCIFLQKKK